MVSSESAAGPTSPGLPRKLARRMLLPVLRRLRRVWGFLRWVVPAFGGLTRRTPPAQRRLLMVYDLLSQPFSIGDLLGYQEASLVLRERHGVDKIDFAVVYDPKRPAASDAVFSSVNEENVVFHLAGILPAMQVNVHLGSMLIFDAHEQVQRYIADNTDRYVVWPPAWNTATRDYMSYTMFNDLVYSYFQEHGRIPPLASRRFLNEWARGFFREQLGPYVPVTVQIRNNPKIHTHRNLRLECWLEFFRHCEEQYPVRFVIISALSEVDDRLRQCSNLIIAKDHHTTLEQDLALIEAAAIHMGAASGPGTIAIFNERPFLLVNADANPALYRGMIVEDGFLRYAFSSPVQRFAQGETTELLIAEFARMWRTIDVSQWTSTDDDGVVANGQQLSWLR
jgi:hypothetical protein